MLKVVTHPIILGLGGGLRGESHSLTVLKVTLEAVEKAGVQTELMDLQTLRLPFYEPAKTLKDYPQEVKDFIEKIARADGYVWSSPAYHGTVSGVVKNALDFIEFLSDQKPPYLDGKPVGLISTAGGTMAAVTTIQALIHTAHALRAWVVPLTIAIPQAWRLIDEQGRLKDPALEDRLKLLGNELVKFISRR
ncbi:MAG TPA: NAD(P)H-dependent oxidoreductase [Nitrospiria bacterium]|nr:NAD(P)H-dependent oxidoreductase [Nitrospiria bacterium]